LLLASQQQQNIWNASCCSLVCLFVVSLLLHTASSAAGKQQIEVYASLLLMFWQLQDMIALPQADQQVDVI
jgi:hypothetical protein